MGLTWQTAAKPDSEISESDGGNRTSAILARACQGEPAVLGEFGSFELSDPQIASANDLE